MNVIKFKENHPQPKTKTVYCIVDKTSLISHNREVIKNISDWTIQNITIQGYTVLVSVDEDAVLREAMNSGATHAVVLSTGTEFINSYDWFAFVDDYCLNNNVFIAGHILDRQSAYYELHHQCYIINLLQYKELGCPEIGQQELCVAHTQIEPLRGWENFHDAHTPKLVHPGTESRDYEHKCHGWNILSIAWANRYRISVFNDSFRNNKIHYYPEYDSYYEQINYAHNRESFCNGMAVYLGNSELAINTEIQGPIEQLVISASGLNWISYLKQCGFTESTVVKFYDYSYLTLEYMKHLVDMWNGVDYAAFARDYMDNKFSFIGGNIPYCGSQELEEIDPQLWQQIKSFVKFEYHWINVLDSSKDVDWITPNVNTVINLTNVFNYIGTAATRSVRERVYAENRFIEKLQARVPDAHVILTRRAADGFIDIRQHAAVLAKDIELTDIRLLTKPTWHVHDWSN
jgi:hypothetical protein